MEELKRRDVWSDREIRAMLSIVHEKHMMQLTDSKIKRNKSIFEDIVNELKKQDIRKSHMQVRNKFKSLKCDYFKAKRNNNKRGAKRQTSEHFDLLDEIFESHPSLETEGVDVAEMDCENIKIENIPVEDEEISLTQTAEENNLVEEPEENKLRSFKRTRKQSYQNVVQSFMKEWKESQQDLIQNIKEHDQKLMDRQIKQQEELLGKSLEAMEKILEKDREETAKMLQGFLTAVQPTSPHMFHAQSAFMEASSSNATGVPAPKSSPHDSNSALP